MGSSGEILDKLSIRAKEHTNRASERKSSYRRDSSLTSERHLVRDCKDLGISTNTLKAQLSLEKVFSNGPFGEILSKTEGPTRKTMKMSSTTVELAQA